MGNLLNTSIGEYRLVDFVGAGGTGEVYRAVHAKIGRVVAIKLLTQPGYSPSAGARFINEARIQAGLVHPHIATLYDFLEINGRPCIIMEYVDGQTLYERIQAHGPLPLAEAVFIFQAVVEAIIYIHGHGIVHRDLKSNNIKISASGNVKLLDFGIAKDTTTPRLTMDGHYVGTLHYLAPEQMIGKKTDARSDIWSLGVLLFEMVTGKLPFEAASISELCGKISKAQYQPPSALNPAVPSALEAILSRCLRKNPSERYGSARELLRDLRQLSATASLPGPSTFRRCRSAASWPIFPAKIKDHWPLLSAAMTLALVLLISLLVSEDKAEQTPTELANQQPRIAYQSSQSSAFQPALDSRNSFAPIKIETSDGPADVYEHGRHVGQTPYSRHYPVGEKIDLVLKRHGYQDKAVRFEVRKIHNQYSYFLDKGRHE